MKRDPSDWDESDLNQFVALPHGLTLDQLQRFELPLPDYVSNGRRCWADATIVAWLDALHTAFWLSHPRDREAAQRFITDLDARGVPDDGQG